MNFLKQKFSLLLLITLVYSSISDQSFAQSGMPLNIVKPWCKVTSREVINRSRDQFTVKQTQFSWEGLQVTLSGDEAASYDLPSSLAHHLFPWRHELLITPLNIEATGYDCSIGWCVPDDYELIDIYAGDEEGSLVHRFTSGDKSLIYNDLGYVIYYGIEYGQGASIRHSLSYDCSIFTCKLVEHTFNESEGLAGGAHYRERTKYFWTGNTAYFTYKKDRTSAAYSYDTYPKDIRYGEVTVLPTAQILEFKMFDHDDQSVIEHYEYDCRL